MKIIECPRDAMQGLKTFIPTSLKAEYLNILLQVGFDTIDFGSFVSSKAIPQLSDTKEVLAKLNLGESKTKLLAIVANLRGAEEASSFEQIQYLGYPFSISETFQQRNSNSSIAQSLETVKNLLELCDKHKKTANIYLSMAFGNPYGDEWNADLVEQWTEKLLNVGVKLISLSDTIGIADNSTISSVVQPIIQKFQDAEIGIHLHSTPSTRLEKMEAAYIAGCKRWDSALRGFGGCPMAKDELTGNLATEDLVTFLEQKGEKLDLNKEKLMEAMAFSTHLFDQFH